jgi:serine phosphatase RsbU (regulator of sigma subunit)
MKVASGQEHPARTVAIVIAFGIVLTALSTWGVARVDANTEERLLDGQTRQAASVLSTAVLVIEQPLRAQLDVQSLTERSDETRLFESGFAPNVGADKTFVTASLWFRDGDRLDRVANVGPAAGLDGSSARGQALFQRALSGTTSVVERVPVGDQERIGYAMGNSKTGYVVYAERALPASRRAPVDRDSSFADLDYAIYLGRGTASADLSTTSVRPAELPFTGMTSKTEVPFGDTVLTLVTSPKNHLGNPLSQRLPVILALSGLLLTFLSALIVRRLVRARSDAENNTATITTLYERVDNLYEEQRALFVRLQRALLPQVNPTIPQIEIASRYVAGAQGVDIGGDWYSVIAIDEDRFAFVVGDVSGHGVDAVAVMAHARFTLRAYLVDGDSPEIALEKCSKQFDITVDDHMITAIVGVGNWRTGEFVLANAGHPPPLLTDGEQVDFVSTIVGPPLGVGPSAYKSVTITLPPGNAVVMYTDGLIERRTEDIDAGMNRLVDVVVPIATRPLEDLVDQVLDSLRDDDAADDIALLALRRLDS